MTYSINNGTSIEAKTINIIGATSVDFTQVLDVLHDNINGDINPSDIRDATLTLYSNIEYKLDSYIGLGATQSNTKLYFGKRSYNNIDILNNALLNSDSDIYFYNTKIDSISNSETKISLNNSVINSQLVILNQTQSTVSLDFISNNLINIESNNININNLYFPYNISDINNKTLIYNDGQLIFEYAVYNATSSVIGNTISYTNINGNLLLNNYSLEFTDTRECPIEIGDIKVGDNFNKEPIENILRRMIYNYLPPKCELYIRAPYSNGYIEIGSNPNIILDYRIEEKSKPIISKNFTYMTDNGYKLINDLIIGSANGLYNNIDIKSTTFSLVVSDGISQDSSSVSISGIYPYFYGISDNNITTSELLNLSKIIEPFSDKSLYVYGTGNLYFIQDYNYIPLTNIYDEMGESIFDLFTYSVVTLSSPNGYWYSKEYRVYKYNDLHIDDISRKYTFVSKSISLDKVLINNGDVYTDNSNVNILLNTSGYDIPTYMRYSESIDGLGTASWISYNPTFSYDFGVFDINAIIYAQIKSNMNETSLIKSDNINILSPYITFDDPVVKQICVDNWGSDGEITYEQAASVTASQFGTTFRENVNINTFDELQYFTGLDVIPDEAFEFCSNLTSVIIPNTVMSLPYQAFSDATSLASIIIPNSVINIGQQTFVRCNALTSVIIPDSVITLGSDSFRLCDNLTNIIIGNSVQSIGNWTFMECPITSIILPDSCQTLGNLVGYNMNTLTNLVIGISMNTMGDLSFYQCPNLINVDVRCQTPPTIGANVLSSANINLVIHIPVGTKTTYETATGWNNFVGKYVDDLII